VRYILPENTENFVAPSLQWINKTPAADPANVKFFGHLHSHARSQRMFKQNDVFALDSLRHQPFDIGPRIGIQAGFRRVNSWR
jgi:hypothetical protein